MIVFKLYTRLTSKTLEDITTETFSEEMPWKLINVHVSTSRMLVIENTHDIAQTIDRTNTIDSEQYTDEGV